MIEELARAKVNLALRITGRRADGYHTLDSIVAFADMGDRLTFEPADASSLEISGPFAAGLPVEDNLVLRAANGLAASYAGTARPARIHLEKNLPVAAGLGGGSADAAAAIRGLLRLWDAQDTPMAEENATPLAEFTLSLGADVPICISSRACRMTGIGEFIEPLGGFPSHPAVLVNDRTPVATAAVFLILGMARGATCKCETPDVAHPQSWTNDLLPSALSIAPGIATVLDALRAQAGAVAAGLSGSGGTCFGVFESTATAKSAAHRLRKAHPGWWCVATVLR